MTYTVVGDTKAGGKVNLDETTGNFSFLPYTTAATPGGTDQFKVLVAEKTALDDLLEQNPVVKYLVQPILVSLHQVPILNVVLSPLIGRSRIVTVNVDVSQLVSDYQNPIAFTTTVISFDGTPISVNYFPKVGLTDADTAPTILNGPSLATAGYTDPNQVTTVVGLVPGLKTLRPDYNVVTWDPRGEFASGGKLHLDSEDFEAKDVSAIISWVAGLNSTAFDPGTAGAGQPADRHGGRLLWWRHPADVGRHRQPDRRDRAGYCLEFAERRALPEPRFQDVVGVTAAALAGGVGLPARPGDLLRYRHRRGVRLPHPAPTGIPVQQQPRHRGR